MKLSEQLQQYFRSPAIDLGNGRIVEGELGDTHSDIMAGLPPGDQSIPNIGHGFVDHNSNYHSRERARLFLRRRGVDMPDQPGEGPSSEMLRGDFDTQYPQGYPTKTRPLGGSQGDNAPRPPVDYQRSSPIWYQSGQRTIYRFANGYGLSVVNPADGSGIRCAIIKFTDDPQNPFFIHYGTPLGGPQEFKTLAEVDNLLPKVEALTDESVEAYMRREGLRGGS